MPQPRTPHPEHPPSAFVRPYLVPCPTSSSNPPRMADCSFRVSRLKGLVAPDKGNFDFPPWPEGLIGPDVGPAMDPRRSSALPAGKKSSVRGVRSRAAETT